MTLDLGELLLVGGDVGTGRYCYNVKGATDRRIWGKLNALGVTVVMRICHDSRLCGPFEARFWG